MFCITLFGSSRIMPTSLNWDPVAFILTASALAATISGIGFALYGYFNTHMAEKVINKKLDDKFTAFEKKLQQENRIMQKVIAGYNSQFQLKNIDMAVSLYQQAVDIYPAVYNGYTSLAYAYWYDKKDLVKAKEYFNLALHNNPGNYQCLNDLARFSAVNVEPITTFQYIKQMLEIKPGEYEAIEKDPIFNSLKTTYPDHYKLIIENAKNKSKNT